MRDLYMNFMDEYLLLGHMTKVSDAIISQTHYIIPHQCVLRLDSLTTKLRVVFDASSKTTSQYSLNDILMVGATVQSDLYSILLRFRLNKFAITADITKMYRQIEINKQDRQFQLILWRRSPNEPLGIYRLNTVTYGTASAPFLATRVLCYLSDTYENLHPIGASALKKCFYVDDLLTGADSVEEVEEIISQVTQILQLAEIPLAKWYSNIPKYCNSSHIDFNKTETTKTLGVKWIQDRDCFQFSYNWKGSEQVVTKRRVLSISSRLFDPLGLLSPLIILVKMFMQELWLHNLDWDQPIPPILANEWHRLKSQLHSISSIEIPRFVNTTNNASIEIHGFADASQRAYGCCLYVRSTRDNIVTVHLLTAKSKVAPLKTKSLPRLELCAAHLLAKLWSKVQHLLTFTVQDVYFWSDSEIVLFWLKTHPSTMSTFVGNRVSDIQDRTQVAKWRYVPSRDNPADIVSRGCTVEELKQSIWLTGPKFLAMNSSKWPSNSKFELSITSKHLELRKVKTSLVAQSVDKNFMIEVMSKFSSFNKLLKVVVYVLRWRYRKFSSLDECLPPSASEMHLAFLKLASIVQNDAYAEAIVKCEKSHVLPKALQCLNPFVQRFSKNNLSFSLFRVGGRLHQSHLPPDTKFPLLMPKDSHFVKIYLTHLHLTNLHAGVKILIGLSRQQIWIVNARRACRQIVRNCVHCFKYKPRLQTQIMGNLPSDRIREVRPFWISGVDFCGPFYVTLKIRKRPPIKTYLAIFVCFSSKAVHLELVSDLSTNSFILCLKRFIGRRGLPHKLLCDNATNFVGAARLLDSVKGATTFASDTGFEIHFIPPRAPHFGGLWEAAVKSAKNLMLRSIGKIVLTTEELTTITVEVESILNSRPIAPLSDDPNDGEALTPAHLLIGETLRSLPLECAQNDVNKISSLRQWRMLSALKSSFWQLWSRDYLLSLQQRTKWCQDQPNLEVGSLVLIHEDNLRPNDWLMGRVIATIIGTDGKARVAEVQTKRGIFKRPIHKLALLPVEA